MSIDQYNTLARQQLISQSILKKQLIYTFTGNPATINNTINIGGNFVRMAGLLTRFIVEVIATFAELGSSTTVAQQICCPIFNSQTCKTISAITVPEYSLR
jgi:hypothetical protein